MGYSLYLIARQMLINVIGVFVINVVFLVAHDYLDCYKFGINIANPLIKTIYETRSYNVIQVIVDNATNCKATRPIIEDM